MKSTTRSIIREAKFTARSTMTPNPTIRAAAGWVAFYAAHRTLRLSAALLGREAPLGHVARDLADRLGRVPRSSADPVA